MSTCPIHGSYELPLGVFGTCPCCTISRELFVTAYERDAWKGQCESRGQTLKTVMRERDELLARLKIVESVTGSGTWVWSDTADNDLASMSNSMVLTMTAGQLRCQRQDAKNAAETERDAAIARAERIDSERRYALEALATVAGVNGYHPKESFPRAFTNKNPFWHAVDEVGKLKARTEKVERELLELKEAIGISSGRHHDALWSAHKLASMVDAGSRAEKAERDLAAVAVERDVATRDLAAMEAAAQEDIAQEDRVAAERDAAIARAEKAERERSEALSAAHGAIDVDHSGLARALNSIRAEVRGRAWITESRGPYEWDDDRYRDEAAQAFAAVLAIVEAALAESGQRVVDHKQAVEAMRARVKP